MGVISEIKFVSPTARVRAACMAQITSTPPNRLSSPASRYIADMRSEVGKCIADDVQQWRQAVNVRDPVPILKRSYPSVNRATFKLREVVSRLFPDHAQQPPRNAVFLAEAPGGFLYCARQMWPDCECHAMSSTAQGAIAFTNPSDPAVLKDLPLDADIRRIAVQDAIVDRCGAASIQLVSADGGVDVENLDIAEQHCSTLVLAQAATALLLQASGGCLVLKIFEGCTMVTRQLFEILRGLYKKIILFKPLTSKIANSERYIVAMGLKSPVVASQVAERLRSLVERCVARCDLADEGISHYISSLGVPVGDDTHAAFDRMATEQARAIEHIVQCIKRRRTSQLRSAATNDARDVDELFRRYSTMMCV